MIRFLLILTAFLTLSDARVFKPNRFDDRIVGGNPTDIKNFPHQVSVQFKKQHICGGSILSETFVLTAAHCIISDVLANYAIRAGSTDHTSGGFLKGVSKIFTMDLYDKITMDFDFAIMQIHGKFKYGLTIAPVPLANAEPAKGTAVRVSGWGALNQGGNYPKILYAVDLQIYDRDKCAKAYADDETIISPVMICAQAASKDACQGDSGGPLVSYKPSVVQVGVVSWGFGCADPKYPGVFSNIANATARAWIKQISGV